MYNEIVENIQRNLSGNPDLDKDYLVSQLDFYKNHEYAPQITKEISGMFWDCLSPEEVDFLNQSHQTNEILKSFDNVIELLENNDKKAALELLDRFFENFIDKYSSSFDYQYLSLRNPLEVLMFYNCIGFNNEKLEVYNTDDKMEIKNINSHFERRSVHGLGNYNHFGIEDPIAYRRNSRKRKGFCGNNVIIRKIKDENESVGENKSISQNNGHNEKSAIMKNH